MKTHAYTCVRLCVWVCACSAVVLLVARLQDCVESVCNKCAQASGPRKIYHKQEGRKRMEQVGARREHSGKRNEDEEKRRWGRKREDRLVKRRRKGGQGLLSPGSCYVSHYVSPGHRQHASRQNKRVSLAWHSSYFPILGTGSGRGQAAGWGAGGIVGSGLASKTQKAQGSSTSWKQSGGNLGVPQLLAAALFCGSTLSLSPSFSDSQLSHFSLLRWLSHLLLLSLTHAHTKTLHTLNMKPEVHAH